MLNSITFITGNNSKLKEFERLLGVNLEICKMDLPEVQSTDVRDVVKIKAQFAYEQIGRACFVDDTGLTIRSWGNLPGALIKWFIDNVGNGGILKMLSSYDSRDAYVTTAVGYCDQNGVKVFTGEVAGMISEQPRGENGFGYDEIFVPEGSGRTFAQMSNGEKDMFSMRSLAADEFKKFLLNNQIS